MSSLIPTIHEDLSPFSEGTIIEFASTPIHIATSLEILANNPRIDWEYKYWGNSTLWKNGMNLEFFHYKSEFPEGLSNYLMRLNVQKGKFTTDMPFSINRVRSRFSSLERLIQSCKKVSDLRVLDGEFGNVGAAVANAYASIFNDKYTNISWNIATIRKLVLSYLQVYESTVSLCEQLEQRGVSRSKHVFITYNGRFLHERAVRDACDALGFPIYFHETTRDRYFLRSEGFHDRIANQKLWLSHWQNSDQTFEEKYEIAKNYYEGLEAKENPFHTREKNLFNPRLRKPYLIFFTSNDDETLGFWDVWKEQLGNQLEVIDKLYSFFSTKEDIELIIRIHPNTKNKPWQVRRIWSGIRSRRNVFVIDEESRISSIELAKESLGVITFGSTIGLQSSFLKKPVCVLADCAYDLLDCVTKINDMGEFYDWCENLKMSKSFNKETWEDSLVRPYFVATAGVRFKIFTISLADWNSWSPDPSTIESLYPSSLKVRRNRMGRRLKIAFLKMRHIFNFKLD